MPLSNAAEEAAMQKVYTKLTEEKCMTNVEKKATNPKDVIGVKKVPLSCLSSQSLALVANSIVSEGLVEAVQSEVPVIFEEQFDAAVCHLMRLWEGIGDEVSPPCLAKAMARIMAIRAAVLTDNLKSSVLSHSGLHVKELNAKAVSIIEKLPPAVPPFLNLPPDSLGFKVDVVIDENTPFHVLPWRVVMEMALGMLEGGIKYGKHNYRACGVRASVYYDATGRHLADFIEGTRIDEDSGLCHLTKALSSSQVLLDSMVMGNWVDDRPMRINRG